MNAKDPANKGQTLVEVVIAIAVGTLIVTAILGLAARANRNATFSKNQEVASKLAQQSLEVVMSIRSLDDPKAVITMQNPVAPCAAGYTSFSKLYECDITETISGCPTEPLCDEPVLTKFVAVGNTRSPIYGHRYGIHEPDEPNPTDCSTGGALPSSHSYSWCLHGNGDSEPYFEVNIGGVNFKRALYVADTRVVDGGLSKCNDYDSDSDGLYYDESKQVSVVVTWTDSSGYHDMVVVSCIGNVAA
ncbi:MAG: prepilin-type N-terminal cleavage/methylation domain-containing protein [Candidatus Woykebacteria bacterium]